MSHSFFALISRLRAISRWGLMRNSLPENVQEHSHMVAVLAHALALIRRDVFHAPCDPERCATLALFHDASEILTGDLPTPIKYFNGELTAAYKQLEALAETRLADCLPDELRDTYAALLSPGARDNELLPLVKAADKLCAYIKCMEERKAGNMEFLSAERQTRAAIDAMGLPEVDYFAAHFLPAFELNLDELRQITDNRRRD
ncbi:MAG: 5'-deoxynucleotidase [Firmicutes bacterium]|nr:5'-deoxynucleotidase [Bacillota bacterium]